jgi:uncharacterized protein YjbJ (UPF0337 family)
MATQTKENVMNKDRIEGAGREAKGKIKAGVGKATGDEKLKTEGKIDETTGKAQNSVGRLKDTLKE